VGRPNRRWAHAAPFEPLGDLFGLVGLVRGVAPARQHDHVCGECGQHVATRTASPSTGRNWGEGELVMTAASSRRRARASHERVISNPRTRRAFCGERRGQFGACCDAELGEDAVEVCRDRAV
jgi:hypothetical protein